MAKYQGIIFDLDGTLLNTLDDLADSVNYALTQCALPNRSIDEVRQFVGNGVANLISRAVPAGTQSKVEEVCLQQFRAHYAVHMRDKTGPYPGITALLAKIKDAGIQAAVVSNKFDAAVKELCKLYFGDFPAVAIGEGNGRAKKPAPDAVFAALDILGLSPSDAVYVGDSDVDIQTAQNAGMDCISVTWGFRDAAVLCAEGATCLIETPQALWEAFF